MYFCRRDRITTAPVEKMEELGVLWVSVLQYSVCSWCTLKKNKNILPLILSLVFIVEETQCR